MMETVEVYFDGVPLLVPLVAANGPVAFPHDSFETFDEYCGAGWTAKIVPDVLFGVNMGPACYIHDLMFEIADRTWADFHHSNSVFLHNMLSIHYHFSGRYDHHKYDRLHRIISYYHAVDTDLGKYFFGKFEDEIV